MASCESINVSRMNSEILPFTAGLTQVGDRHFLPASDIRSQHAVRFQIFSQLFNAGEMHCLPSGLACAFDVRIGIVDK